MKIKIMWILLFGAIISISLSASWTSFQLSQEDKITNECAKIINDFNDKNYKRVLRRFDYLSAELINIDYPLFIKCAEEDFFLKIFQTVHVQAPELMPEYILRVCKILNSSINYINENHKEIDEDTYLKLLIYVFKSANLLLELNYIEESVQYVETGIDIIDSSDIPDVYRAFAHTYAGLIMDECNKSSNALDEFYESFNILHQFPNDESLITIEDSFELMINAYINGTAILFEDLVSEDSLQITSLGDVTMIMRRWAEIRQEIVDEYGHNKWNDLITSCAESNEYILDLAAGQSSYELFLYSLLDMYASDLEQMKISWQLFLNSTDNSEHISNALHGVILCLEQRGLVNMMFDVFELSRIRLYEIGEYDKATIINCTNALMASVYSRNDLSLSYLSDYVTDVLNYHKPEILSPSAWVYVCIAVAELYHESELSTFENIYSYIEEYIISNRNTIDCESYQLFIERYCRILTRKKEYQRAEELLEEVIIESQKNDRTYYLPVTEMFDLAYIYMFQEKYDEAEQMFLNCIDLYNEYYNLHWNVCLAYQNLSYIYRQNKDYCKQKEALDKRFKMGVRYFSQSLFTMNSFQRASFWEMHGDFLEGISGVSIENNGLVSLAYNIALYQKGFLLRYFDIIHNNIYKSKDRYLIEAYEKYKKAERCNDVNTAELERYMMKLYSAHTEFLDNDCLIYWETVQDRLRYNDLAIEFTVCHKDDCNTYAALLLKKGWDSPRMIELCEETELKRIMSSGTRLYNENAAAYSCIWEKLEPYFKKGDNIYFAPHGLIHQLNIEVLCGADGKPMNKKCNLYRVSNTGNLAEDRDDLKYNSATLYGGLNYDTDTTSMLAINRNYVTTSSLQRGRLLDESVQTRAGWSYLPGTAEEVRNVGNILDRNKIETTTYTDEVGTEESFKALSGNSTPIIHIATHGFYLEDKDARKEGLYEFEYSDIVKTISPLKRSGLIFSGGQHAWLGREIPEGIDDGVLTAEEIAGMNLTGTDLLVLSACQTGLGEITNEGVEGLQMGFKIAGVNTIIMSLWEVSDAATEVLMTKFYSLLIKGKTKREAFDAAVEAVKKEYPSPEYWAAFIMLD